MSPSFASSVLSCRKKKERGASRMQPKGLVLTHKPKLNSAIPRHPGASREKQKQARQPGPVSLFLPLLLYQNKRVKKRAYTSVFNFSFPVQKQARQPFHFGLFAFVKYLFAFVKYVQKPTKQKAFCCGKKSKTKCIQVVK